MRIARVQGYRNRQALVKICFILIVLIFTYRAFSVSEIQANDISLKTKASKNSEFVLVEKSMRGNILDRNNNLLAINLIHKKINLDPMIIQDEYIDLLAEALEIPFQDFRDQIANKKANKRKYFIVKDKLKVNDPILKKISEWPKCIDASSTKLEPHRIPIYLYELASEFHSYWNLGKQNPEKRFINDQKNISDSKLVFLKSISNVIKSGMNIVGVDTPEKM